LLEKSNELLSLVHSREPELLKIGVGGVHNKESFDMKFEKGAFLSTNLYKLYLSRPENYQKIIELEFFMELLISLFVILFLVGAISFLKPSKKMKALSEVRMSAAKEGFKIGSTNELRKKFKNWSPQVAIYQIKNSSNHKNLHYLKIENKLKLYEPISFKYEKQFQIVEENISKLPSSVLEIIFYQSNIAIVWNEMLGIKELLKIKEALQKI
jgi:hypothetical protein